MTKKKRKSKYYDIHVNTFYKCLSIMYFAGANRDGFQVGLDKALRAAKKSEYFLAAKRKAP